MVKTNSVPRDVRYEGFSGAESGADADDDMSFIEALREVFGQGKNSLLLATIMLNTVTAYVAAFRACCT
jgi:hypothetical protein